MFNNSPAPYFMTIPWELAKEGDTLNLTNDQINNDQRNIKTIERMAKNCGVDIEIGHSPEGVVILILKTKKKNFNSKDCDNIMLYITDINQNPTVTDIYKNAGIEGSRMQLNTCLRHMVEAGQLEEERHQPDGGGRPTTKYKIKQ